MYGDPLVHPQPETYWGNVNPVGPRGVYDEAKRFAEALTMAYRTHHGVDTGIVRIFNTFGPRMRPDDGRAIPTFIRQALRGEPLTVAGDGSQTRSICYVDDLVEGILALVARRPPRPDEHRQPARAAPMLDLARWIGDLAGLDVGASCHRAAPADDPRVRQPDITLRRRRCSGWAAEGAGRGRGCGAPSSGSGGTPSSSEPRAPDGAAQAEDGSGSLRLPSEPPSSPASSTVSGWAMLSSDWPSALTPRNAATMPPATMSAAPMK